MGDLTPVLGIICGMTSEVRALGRWANDPRIGIGISGARPDRAEAEARRLAAQGSRVLLSWGVAGGLDPELSPGSVVIPTNVLTQDEESWPASIYLRAAVVAGSHSSRCREDQGEGGHLLGLDRMVLTVTEKATLFRHSGAAAADMESHRVALVAAEAKLPMLVIRAIGDPAGRALPALVTRALGEDGRPRIGQVIAGLLRRPGDLGALLRAKRDADAALAALAGIADNVLPVALTAAKREP